MTLEVHPAERRQAYRESGQWSSETITERVRKWATSDPERVAVIDGSDGRRITFGQLWDDATRFAAALGSRGIQQGEGISVQLPNRYETVVVFVGAFLLGARLNPLLPSYGEHELRHILTTSRARVHVTPRYYRGIDYVALGASLGGVVDDPPLHVLMDFGGEEGSGAGTTYAELIGGSTGEGGALGQAPSEVCELIFTSGTEATPKAVMHSEETTNFSIRSSFDHLHMSEEDVVWMPSPIGHSTGLNFGVRMSLFHGIPIVLQDIWNPDQAARIIQEFRPTYTLAATTFLSDTVRSVRQAGTDASSLVRFGCGGAPVPPALVSAASDLGIGVLRLYGSTEALLVSWNRPETDDRRKQETDGEVIDGVQVRVVRGAAREDVPTGEPGELLVRGPNVCLGFFADLERTAAAFDTEGWLSSGDLGVVADDHVTIVGRKKEVIIRGGMNIAPREVEDVLSGMPGIADIAVTGFEDERLGEIVCVHVVPEPGSAAPDLAEITDFLHERRLAKFKWPQRLVVVDELPRTSTGKVRRTVLRQRAEATRPEPKE